MNETANVRRIAALIELAAGLRRYTERTQEHLRLTAAALQALLEQQQVRVHVAHRRVEQARADLEWALAALRRCEESEGYGGYGGSRDCSDAAEQVCEASARCRAAEEALAAARRLLSEMEHAANVYRHAATGVHRAAVEDGARAVAYLERAVDRLDAYANLTVPTPPPPVSPSVAPASTLPTWSEQQAILRRLMAGETISVEDLRRLDQPASDLQAITLHDQSDWAQSLDEAEQFVAAARASKEASDVLDAFDAFLQVTRRSRRGGTP